MAITDQYAFDPYQSEEEDIKAKELAAREVLKRLRTPQQMYTQGGVLTSGRTGGQAFKDTVDEGQAEKDIAGLSSRRAALSARVQTELADALRQGTPEAMIQNPILRQAGLGEMQADRKRSRQMGEMQDILKSLGGASGQPQDAGQPQGGPDVNDLRRKAIAMSMHPDAEISKRGQMILKQLEGGDPSKQFVTNPLTGGSGVLPGAMDAQRGQEQLQQDIKDKSTMIDVPIGGGRSQKMSLYEYKQRSGGQAQSPQSPQPSGPMVGPGVGAAPSVGPAGALPNSMAAQGGFPAGPRGTLAEQADPNSPPNAEELRIHGGPEGIQKAFADLTAKGKMQAADYYANLATKYNIPLYAANQGTESQRANMAMTDPQGTARALPKATAASGDGFGVSDPEGGKFRETAMASGRKLLDADRTNLEKQVSALKTVQQMSELNQKGDIISGPLAGAKLTAKRAWAQTFGGPDPSVSDTEFYDKLNLSQLRDSLKAYGSGTGISNLDLLTAMKTLPGTSNTPEGRQYIIDYMQGTLVSNVKNYQNAEAYYAQNRTLDGFMPKNYDKDGNPIGQQEMNARMAQIKKQADFSKKIAGQLEQDKAAEPLYMNTMKDVGGHLFDLSRGEPEHVKNFAQGAAVGAGLTPVGRGAMMAGRAAIPAAQGIGRFLSTPGGGALGAGSVLALVMKALNKEQ